MSNRANSNTSDAAQRNGDAPMPETPAEKEADDNYVIDLEDRLERSQLLKTLIRAFKDICTSTNAPKAAKEIAEQVKEARQAEARAHARIVLANNVTFLLGLGACFFFLAWVINTLKSDKELLLPVITALVGLIAGTGGGYLFGRQSGQK